MGKEREMEGSKVLFRSQSGKELGKYKQNRQMLEELPASFLRAYLSSRFCHINLRMRKYTRVTFARPVANVQCGSAPDNTKARLCQ